MLILVTQPLCRELYEVSGWDDAELMMWRGDGPTAYLSHDHTASDTEPVAPAYTIDYLFLMLPPKLRHAKLKAAKTHDTREWFAGYWTFFYADSAPDAFCRVAIWLFRKGYLRRQSA